MPNQSPRLLLVDDDPVLLQTYVRALQQYAPVIAHDGLEARRILREMPIDVVLCDLEMPQMSGLDLMRWAKESCPRPAFIVVSGTGTFDAARQALTLGAFDFVCKPLHSLVQLQTVVANAVRHQALLAERELLLSSLADNNLILAESHRKIQMANTVLEEHQARLEEDLRRAERILRSMLPHELPPLDRLQLNAAYRPSSSIGGDLYGAASVDADHLAIFVADAAGHGVSAALLALLFSHRISVIHGVREPRTPSAVLSNLNQSLLEECRASGLFVTVAYAVVDVRQRTLTLASAGHPPSLLLRSSGRSERIEKTGPALGLAPDATYSDATLSLEDGDRLLFYTDGLTGSLAEPGPSVDAIFAAMAGADDGRLVLERLFAWGERGERAEDDITMLLLTASPGVSTFDAREATRRESSPDCPLSAAIVGGTTWLVVRGRATWKDAAALRATGFAALDAGGRVVVDLSSCAMMDSTMLGTLHEVAVHAEPGSALRLQNVTPGIRELLEELAMTQVLATITPTSEAPPEDVIALRPEGSAAVHGLVLHAHELLASLSPSNAAQFMPVIDALHRDLPSS